MKRVVAFGAALVVALSLAAPVALAAEDGFQHTGRVLVSTEGDITVPAGDHADVVVVVRGTATVQGEVNTVVVVDGQAVLTGARTETVFAVRSPVTLGADTVVTGDVLKLDAEVTRIGNASVGGSVKDVALDLAGIGFFLGPAIVLFYVGFALAAIAAALLLAGLAARQVRSAEALISREPVTTLAVGIAGAILPVVLSIGLFVTIVGAPLGVGILLGLMPLVAFVGYLVAAIWIGEFILRRTSGGPVPERPYLAAVVGTIILQVLGIWPFVPMIASLFGFGAVILLAWRILRGSPPEAAPLVRAAPAPLGG